MESMYNAKKKSFAAKQVDTERILGRSLPAHVEAERSVLGALLLNNELVSRVIEVLFPDDFVVAMLLHQLS